MQNLSLKRRLSDWLSGKRLAKLRFETLEEPPEESCEAVRRGLVEYNENFTGRVKQTPLGVFVRDETGRVRGGATGYLGWGWLYTERLWVEDSLRGKGIGSKLMAHLERLALSHGVYRFQVATTSFQALEFFQKNGYEVFATLEDYPPGHTDYSLKKVIDLTGSG